MSIFHIRTFCSGIITALVVAIPAFSAPKATPIPAKTRAPIARKTPVAVSSTKPPIAKPNDPESMESYLRLSKNAEPFRRAADEALKLLRAGKVDAFVARLSPQMVASNGGAKTVRAIMIRDIAPFFAGYKKLGNSETILPANDAYGQNGFSFYLSLIDKAGREKPFAIYIMREKNRFVVANVIPNWTLQKR